MRPDLAVRGEERQDAIPRLADDRVGALVRRGAELIAELDVDVRPVGVGMIDRPGERQAVELDEREEPVVEVDRAALEVERPARAGEVVREALELLELDRVEERERRGRASAVVLVAQERRDVAGDEVVVDLVLEERIADRLDEPDVGAALGKVDVQARENSDLLRLGGERASARERRTAAGFGSAGGGPGDSTGAGKVGVGVGDGVWATVVAAPAASSRRAVPMCLKEGRALVRPWVAAPPASFPGTPCSARRRGAKRSLSPSRTRGPAVLRVQSPPRSRRRRAAARARGPGDSARRGRSRPPA